MKTIEVSIQCFDETPATQLSWVVRNFLCNVCSAYLQGAPRRVQAYSVAVGMVGSAIQEGSINTDEAQVIFKELAEIEAKIYPGCSLL